MKKLILAAGLVSALFFCCKTPSALPVGKDFRLVELQYKTLPADVKATLKFEAKDKHYGGYDACNTYGGSYELEGNTLKFGPALVTKKFCGEVSEWESAFHNMLPQVDNFRYQNNELTLYAGAKIVARFRDF